MARKEVVKELDKEQRIRKHNKKEKGEHKEHYHQEEFRSKGKSKKGSRSNWVRDYDDEEYGEY